MNSLFKLVAAAAFSAISLSCPFVEQSAHGQTVPMTGPQNQVVSPSRQSPVPSQLVGKWSVSSIGYSTTLLTFGPEGTYALISSVGNNSSSTKVYSFEKGTITVQGGSITFHRQNGTLIQKNGGWQTETPLPPVSTTCQWWLGTDPLVGDRMLWLVYPTGQKQPFYERK